MKSLSRVRLFAAPWTVAYHAPLSMGFPGKNTGVGCHLRKVYKVLVYLSIKLLKMELHTHLENKQPLLCSPPLTSYPTSWIQGYIFKDIN